MVNVFRPLVVRVTDLCSYDVSGNHSIPNGYDRDIWAVILDENGNLLWQKCLGGWGNDYFFVHHAVDKISDSRYVFAATTDYKSDDITCDIHAQYVTDGWIVELDLSDTVNSYVTKYHQKISVYPNPSSEYVTFQIPMNDEYEVLIINSMGEQIDEFTIVDGKYTLKLTGYTPGIYLYQIKFQDYVATGKLAVVK